MSIGVVVVVVMVALSNVFGDFANIALLVMMAFANVTTSVPVIAALTLAHDCVYFSSLVSRNERESFLVVVLISYSPSL